MKRLFIILLMNAWGGLRRMPGLPTAAMVLMSAMALIVTSTITAGAAPDLALSVSSQQNTNHTTTHPSASVQTFAFLGATSSPALHAEKSMHPQAGQHEKPQQVAVQPSSPDTTPASDTSTDESGQQSVAGTQTASATLSPLAVQQDCVQGDPTYSVKSLQLNFQNPTTAKTTVTWHWETRLDSGTNSSGAAPASSSPDSQTIPANAATAVLSASNGSPQVFSATASQSYAYSFRVDVMVNGTEISSDWYSVPQAAGACQQQSASSTVK